MLTLSLGCAADPGNTVRCRVRTSVLSQNNKEADIHYTVYKTLADNIHYPILKARGGVRVEGSKMSYFDFYLCYKAGQNIPNAKSGRLI